LHVEWLTRTDTRRAIVVADGVGALTKSAEEVAAGRRASQRKVFSTSFLEMEFFNTHACYRQLTFQFSDWGSCVTGLCPATTQPTCRYVGC